MKKRNLVFLAALLITCLVSAAVCYGAAVTPKWTAYDYKDKVEAPTGFVDGTSSAPMATFCTIKDGALALNSMANPSAGPTYKLMISTPPAVGYKFTIVVRAKVDSDLGMDFDFRATLRERIILKSSEITMYYAPKADTSVKTTEWHTYFISYEIISDAGVAKLVTKVYVDGATTPLLQGLTTTADTSNYFRFGDGSSSTGYAGSIDWIVYTFDGAFSPDQVNMPEGFKLK